ncbi:MAG: hypothetical protein JKX76_01345 [Colwellia sp.]|nr:hypothetical protein [Colwellia sp.]
MSQLAIRESLETIHGINTEFESIATKKIELEKRKLAAMENVREYLRQSGQDGVKYKDFVIMLKNKAGRVRRKKAEKKADLEQYLQSQGANPALAEGLINNMMGERIETEKLVIEKKSTRARRQSGATSSTGAVTTTSRTT